MRLRLIVLFVVAVASMPVHAQLSVGGGLDYLRWTEDTAPEVRERGALLVLTGGYTQRRDKGALFAWRGTLYGGAVDYDGSTLFPPLQTVQGTTDYGGTSQEAQFRYRIPVRGGARVDLVAAGGFDLWRRQLSTIQKEDYLVGFVRLGLELDRDGRGLIAGGGLKQPIRVRERAYLDGMNPDPIELRPGNETSFYLMLGYQLDRHWRIAGTLDSFRFSRSPATGATVPGFGAGQFFQPASTLYRVGARVEYVFR
ncbi:MAG: hypothetical protein ABI794_16955 [Betaproteobacteria bacterium]